MKATTADAMLLQSAALREWLHQLPFAAFARPSVLPGWDVRQVTGHILLIHLGLLRWLGKPTDERPLPPHEFVRRYREEVDAISFSTIEVAADKTPDELLLELDQAIAALGARLLEPLPKAIESARGPTLVEDFLTTRVIELIVHSDDLSRSVPNAAPVPLERAALAIAIRSLADILARQHPGKSVEVRVPPFAAVQCIEGPAHTRGTPANVIETDPVTFLRLATGRVTWAEVVSSGVVSASGNRADLTGVLPVLS